MATVLSPRIWILIVVVALLSGGVAGTAVALVLRSLDDSRGQVVVMGPELGYVDGVYCNEFHHFCIPEPRADEELTAFYTFTTHPRSRQQGCPVVWRPRGQW